MCKLVLLATAFLCLVAPALGYTYQYKYSNSWSNTSDSQPYGSDAGQTIVTTLPYQNSSPQIAGTWNGTWQTSMGTYQVTFDIKQAANTLSGSCNVQTPLGHHTRFLSGFYSPQDDTFVLKDVGVGYVEPSGSLQLYPIDRYEIRIIEEGHKLAGSYESAACQERGTFALLKTEQSTGKQAVQPPTDLGASSIASKSEPLVSHPATGQQTKGSTKSAKVPLKSSPKAKVQTSVLSGTWQGSAHGDNEDYTVTFNVSGDTKLSGKLTCSFSGGTSVHYFEGTYYPQTRCMYGKDIGLDKTQGDDSWFPTPIDHYDFHLVEEETKLVGSGQQKTSKLWLSLSKTIGSETKPTNESLQASNRSTSVGSIDHKEPVETSRQDQVETLLDQAMEKHNRGDDAAAEVLFHKVLALNPNNGDANFNLGAIAELKHDLKEAERYYTSALRASPNDSDIQKALADVRLKLSNEKTNQPSKQLCEDAAAAYKKGDYRIATDDLQKYLTENPQDDKAEYAFSQALRGLGDIAGSKEHLGRARDLNPNNPMYKDALASANNAPKPTSDFSTVGDQPDGLVKMQPEPGETLYKLSNSGAGRVAKIAIAQALMQSAMSRGMPGGMGRGLLQGGMMGLAMGLFLNRF